MSEKTFLPRLPALALALALALGLGIFPVAGLSAAPRGPASAPAPAYTLSLSTEAGLLSGEAREIVYNGQGEPGLAEDYVVSRLDWSLEGLPYWGSSLELEARSGFYASLGLRSALPGRYGSIEDRDWLNGDGVLTHYSKHDNHVERAFFADLAAGWEFRPAGPLSWRLGLGLELMSFKWTARDGFLKYPKHDVNGDYILDSNGNYIPWTVGDPIYAVYGTGMAYEQLHLIASLELGGSYALSETWSLSASLGFSFLAYCQDLDNHFLTATDYREWMYRGLYLEPRLELGRALRPGAELLLSASWRSLSGLIGDAYGYGATPQYGASGDIPPGLSVQFASEGGAAYSALSLGLALKMVL